ncbi:carbohydrate porin [Pseudomonas juntendi]|nr:carbohydrate porin [Pseudomonas juntendi]
MFAGADLDLGKLLDNNLGTFHFEYTFFPWMRNEGVPTADKWQGAVGSALAGSVMHNDIDAGYLSLFAYSQNFLDDRLQITAGRTNAKRYFYVSNCGTIVACNDPLIEYTTGILPYPYGSWGGYAKYTVNDNMYVHGGVFESNPEDYLKKLRGFTGIRAMPAEQPASPGWALSRQLPRTPIHTAMSLMPSTTALSR